MRFFVTLTMALLLVSCENNAQVVKELKTHQDSVSYAIRWSVDGQVLADAVATTLPRGRYKLGQLVAVEVTPNDPYGGGQPMASQPLKITGNAPAPRRPAPPAPPAPRR